MKYLIFQELNWKHFLFLSYFMITILEEGILHLYHSTDDIIETFNQYYIYSLSDLLSIIPLLIIKKRSKGLQKKVENQFQSAPTKDIELLYTDYASVAVEKTSKKIFKYEILIAIFEFLALYSNVLFNSILAKNNFIINKINLNSVLIINVFSKYILSILILHSPFYRHHYLSFAINIIFLIVLGVLDIIDIYKENLDSYMIHYFYIIMKIINIIFYSFEDIFAKILLSDSISPYILLLYRGIAVNSFAFIFSLIFIFVELPNEKGINSCVFTRFWKIYENKLNILYVICMFIIEFVWNVLLFFIIDKFSVSHFAIASILESFGSLLSGLIIFRNVEIKDFFIRFVIYFILIIASLIHNEFMVINCCGLELHTKLYLEKMAEKDIKDSLDKNNNINIENEMHIINIQRDIMEETDED